MLLVARDGILFIVDVQTRLAAAMPDAETTISRAAILLDGVFAAHDVELRFERLHLVVQPIAFVLSLWIRLAKFVGGAGDDTGSPVEDGMGGRRRLIGERPVQPGAACVAGRSRRSASVRSALAVAARTEARRDGTTRWRRRTVVCSRRSESRPMRNVPSAAGSMWDAPFLLSFLVCHVAYGNDRARNQPRPTPGMRALTSELRE